MIKKIVNEVWILLLSFFKIPLHILYFFSGFIPRDHRKWLFSSWGGKAYRGNCRYLFEYIEPPNAINPIWFTKSLNSFKALKKRGVNVVYAYSPKGIYSLCTAKCIFVSHFVDQFGHTSQHCW